jgi:flavin-dependent dehydrogenase
MYDADVLILGAGPAGCAAAIRAQQLGLQSLIIEPSTAPKGGPGETFHPGIEAIFRQLGILETVLAGGFHRHRGILVEWDGDPVFSPFGSDAGGDWLGWQIPREELLKLARAAAVQAGSRMIAGAPLSLIERGGWGVRTASANIRAPFILDATGRRRWLAKQLGIRVLRRSPRLLASFGWDDAANVEGDPALSATDDGWNWRAPLGKLGTAWVRLRVGVGEGVAEPSSSAGIDVSWRNAEVTCDAAWYLLGDAAAELDPASSHGVLRAMMSGIHAAHGIAQVLRGEISAAQAAATYAGWLRQTFEGEEKELRALYARHPSKLVADAFAAKP